MNKTVRLIMVLVAIATMFFKEVNAKDGNGNDGYSKDCYTLDIVKMPTMDDSIVMVGITVELSEERACEQDLKGLEISAVQGGFDSLGYSPEGWLSSVQTTDTLGFIGWGYCESDSIYSNNGPDVTGVFYFEVRVDLQGKDKAKIAIRLHTQLTSNLDITYHSREEMFCVEAQPPLPIELVSFEKEGDYLLWTTATEQNNDYFIVEKSDDGINFYEIGEVSGAGNSSIAQSYEFYDETEGTAYYRITQVDYDGTRETFKVISYTGKSVSSEVNVSVYPNPTSEFVNVEANDYVKMTLFNTAGKKVKESTSTSMEVQDVIPGAYIVQVQTTNGSASQQIIIE